VLATDPETGETKAEPVVALIRHSGQHSMVMLTLADGSVLDGTGGHKVWDATELTFVDASQLRAGDKIKTDTGALITIAALTPAAYAYNAPPSGSAMTSTTRLDGATADAFAERSGSASAAEPSVVPAVFVTKRGRHLRTWSYLRLTKTCLARRRTRSARGVALNSETTTTPARESGILRAIPTGVGGRRSEVSRHRRQRRGAGCAQRLNRGGHWALCSRGVGRGQRRTW
jgi:hypothetical protein